MRFLELTQGYVAVVDDEDYERLRQFKWHVSRKGKEKNRYACRYLRREPGAGRGTYQLLHYEVLRMVQPLPDGYVIDHINREGLDCRQGNLRICTRSENLRNQGPIGKSKSSQYKGVYLHRQRRKWAARIKCEGRTYHLGLFGTEQEAVNAYNLAALEVHGEYAFLNHWRGISPLPEDKSAEDWPENSDGWKRLRDWLRENGCEPKNWGGAEYNLSVPDLYKPPGIQLQFDF